MFSHQSSYKQQEIQSSPGAGHAQAASPVADAAGFSLIELLVVILIIGILAGIAIPAFVNQKYKAVDVQAKELARTSETVAETIASDHAGQYGEVNLSNLHGEEHSIATAEAKGPNEAFVSKAEGFPDEYTITVTATDGDELTISRNAEGRISRECQSPSTKTGCDGGEHSSW